MTTEYRCLEPLDVLMFRGNRLFAEAGGHAESQMPPWPSVVSGAIRSRILADRRVPLESFSRSGDFDDGDVHAVLGTPKEPGSFRLSMLAMFRDRGGRREPLHPLPADLVVAGGEARRLLPRAFRDLAPVRISADLPMVAIPSGGAGGKPDLDVLLTGRGMGRHLAGEDLEPDDLVRSDDVWATDPRLGIALDRRTRAAEEGRLYTTDAVAMKPGTGFLVGVRGGADLVPKDGLVRLGGDGRGAMLSAWAPGSTDLPADEPPDVGRFRMVLSTPGLFPEGWLPPGVTRVNGAFVLRHRGLEARLCAASVPRGTVVSGWDLAQRAPKAAVRVAPAGSVYWFEVERGDGVALSEILSEGLWCLERANEVPDAAQRRAEGFNNVWLGRWIDATAVS